MLSAIDLAPQRCTIASAGPHRIRLIGCQPVAQLGHEGKGLASAEQSVGLRTPVVFTLFNRVDVARRVFAAIRAARPRTLLVIADGPRPERPTDAARCAATRAIIDDVDWECEVLRLFADTNIGVRERFSTGFRWVFEQVDEAIFLEHDTLPHPDFFPYCEELLARYRDDPRIMWIGGSNLLQQRSGDASYFFNRINMVWGWATWKSAWDHYDINVRALPEFKRQKLIERITPYRRMQEGFTALLERAYSTDKRSWDNWDIQSTFTIWSRDGVAIHPNVNLVSNIGFDAEAANTTQADDPLAGLLTQPLGPIVHPNGMHIDTEYDIRLFDAHMGFAVDLANAKRYKFVPFYEFGRRVIRAVKRRLAKYLASRSDRHAL